MTYQEMMTTSGREDDEKTKKNEYLVEGVLREILRAQAIEKSEISDEEIPYYERMGFIKEYAKRQEIA